MTRIDQFESVFRAADKPVYVHQDVQYRKILLVSDLERDESAAHAKLVRSVAPRPPGAPSRRRTSTPSGACLRSSRAKRPTWS